MFDLVFERFFFRAAEAQAARHEISESQVALGEPFEVDLDALRQQIAAALRDGDEATLRDLARLAIAAFGRGEGSGVLGVDVQRIRRALGLRTEPQPDLPADDPRRDGHPSASSCGAFEQQLRRELEREPDRADGEPAAEAAAERSRPRAADRADPGPRGRAPGGRAAQAPARHARATSCKGAKRHAHVDVRRTMRASLQTGGVPVELKYRPHRPRRPGDLRAVRRLDQRHERQHVLPVSVLHALHDAFRKLRSFVFIERISEVTEVFERERDFRAASEAVSRDAGVADISGYTDYGRVWTEFLALIEDELHPRATVIVLGDARTNGRPPRDDVFAAITAKRRAHVLAQP